ncbi:hypothetical protein XENOCAPTIV_020432 [Xenoophorus captivus]|uniref:TRAF-type domain-containing protein n=1 Tax=Xenoophorus captivus TaxID=1517983 RepID=A0ABV0RI98_9TELE
MCSWHTCQTLLFTKHSQAPSRLQITPILVVSCQGYREAHCMLSLPEVNKYGGYCVCICHPDAIPCSHPQIYPDPELEQQILALPIRCIHSEEGCRWTGQMKQLQVRRSSYLLRSSLNYPVRCPTHGASLLNMLLCLPQGHFSTCAFNVIPCPNRCSVKLTRRDLPDHLQHDCPKRKVKCEFCGSEFTGEAYEVNTVNFVLFLSSYEYDGKMPGEKTHDVK